MLALTLAAAPEQAANKHKNRTDLKLKASSAKLKKTIECVETVRSHYFNNNDLQLRLGEDFFSQSCISLAKAFLGKVVLPSHL